MLNAGDTQQLTATVSPANAEDKSVVRSSDDTSVATVSQTWLVTCVTPWNCDITVTTVDGWHTAVCGITNSWWSPSIHTLLYCPLDSVNWVSDITGNHTMTAYSSGYWNAPAIDSTGFYKFDWWYIESEAYTWPKQWTISIWLNRSTKHTGAWEAWGYSTHFWVWQPPYHTFALNFWSQRWSTWALVYSNSYLGIYPSLPNIWEWTLWTFTYSDADGAKMYVDWQLYASDSSIWDIYQWSKPTTIWWNGDNQFFEWYLADVIYEDVVWSTWQVGAWYNQSKERYGW